MKFKVHLENTKLFGHHGVLPEEKDTGQVFILNIKFSFIKATTADNIHDTVDYSEVYKTAEKVFNSKIYDLLETLVQDIGSELLNEFKLIDKVKVSMAKLNPPIEGTVEKVTVSIIIGRAGS